MIIGIDLGTTYSVIAVHGRHELTDGYPAPRYIESCDVTVVPDSYGNLLIPSVLWRDPENGEIVVGADAKMMASEDRDPVMFSKRNMGTTVAHPFGDGSLTAREAAREILAFLKRTAETALGRSIEYAVITHPAYFDPAMREDTAAAAREAGFRVDPEQHLLMEPIAAALTYIQGDPRDPLQILTYDLGGGTFDVTVMRRNEGVITVLSFGGNRLLGGYNFDRELARWILDRAMQRGQQFVRDERNPYYRENWAKLLTAAEEIKIRLATARSDTMPLPIKVVLRDEQGRPVTIIDQITRRAFTALIQPLLDETIGGPGGEGRTKGCIETLREVGLSFDRLDEILLVGGSCWGPWVGETIQRAWGREARLFEEPDLCVGVGAAIKASTLGTIDEGAEFTFEWSVPRQALLRDLNVGGRLIPHREGVQPEEYTVEVVDDVGGVHGPVPIAEDGSFFLSSVELRPETLNRLRVMVRDHGLDLVEDRQFEVLHSSEAEQAPSVFTVLPKALYIEVVEGRKPIAEEGATLPAHHEVRLARSNDDDTMEIRLFQETEPIGSVVISGVPRTAGRGARVTLVLDISQNNRISGTATVHTRSGAVAIEAPVDIRIPPMLVPGVDELRREFEELRGVAAERIETERDPGRRLTLTSESQRISSSISQVLADPVPDCQEIWLDLRRYRKMIFDQDEGLTPPKLDFEELLHATRSVIQSRGDPVAQSFTRTLDHLELQGRQAWDRRDARMWGQTFEELRTVYIRLVQPPEIGPDRAVPDSTEIQKYRMAMELDQIRSQIAGIERQFELEGLLRPDAADPSRAEFGRRLRRRLDCLNADLQEAVRMVDAIDDATDPNQTSSKLQVIYHQRIVPLTKTSKKQIEIDVSGG